MGKIVTLRNFSAFLVIIFCINYIPIEGRTGVSLVKVFASFVCFFIFLIKTPKVTNALVLVCIYYFSVLMAAMLHPATFRWGTLLYLASFLLMYVTYYNLLYVEKVLTMNFFIQLLKGILWAFFITLCIQQFFLLIGIKSFPLINLVQILNRGIGANSLSYEPSSSARILAVVYLALLRMWEIQHGYKPNAQEIYLDLKWPTIIFFWSMLTMGSGTAFAALLLLSCYFIKPSNAIFKLSSYIVVILILMNIEFEPLQRIFNSVGSFSTMDSEQIINTDSSAATRIMPILNTIFNTDFFHWETWFGNGVDYTKNQGLFSERILIGGIGDYGFISFIIMQMIIYYCVIDKIVSVETLLWVVLFGMTFGNIPYVWGAILIFTTVRYFRHYTNNNPLTEINTYER